MASIAHLIDAIGERFYIIFCCTIVVRREYHDSIELRILHPQFFIGCIDSFSSDAMMGEDDNLKNRIIQCCILVIFLQGSRIHGKDAQHHRHNDNKTDRHSLVDMNWSFGLFLNGSPPLEDIIFSGSDE